jgi:hypothetical protein
MVDGFVTACGVDCNVFCRISIRDMCYIRTTLAMKSLKCGGSSSIKNSPNDNSLCTLP